MDTADSASGTRGGSEEDNLATWTGLSPSLSSESSDLFLASLLGSLIITAIWQQGCQIKNNLQGKCNFYINQTRKKFYDLGPVEVDFIKSKNKKNSKKNYKQKKKSEISEKMKDYQQEKKAEIFKKMKDYREEKKTEIAEKMKNYRKEKRLKVLKKRKTTERKKRLILQNK